MSVITRFRKSLKPLEIEEWVDIVLYRPLGFLIALPLAHTPVSPNLVTFVSTLVGVISAIFMGLGTEKGLQIGVVLYLFSNVLDCTDGQLARMTQRFSRYGRIFDGVADYIVGFSTFIALGIGWKPEGWENTRWWLLVIMGGMVFTAYQSMHLNHVRESYLHAIKSSHTQATGTKKKRKKQKKSIFLRIFLIPFYSLYVLYLRVERLVRRTVKVPPEVADPERRVKGLKTILVLWTFTGKGTHVTVLAAFLLAGKPEQYFWFTLIPWNLWIFSTWIFHRRLVRRQSNKGRIS